MRSQIEQPGVAIVNSKNRNVVKRQRTQQKQGTEQKLLLGEFCERHRLIERGAVHVDDAAALPFHREIVSFQNCVQSYVT
jgi:hypothetical protein